MLYSSDPVPALLSDAFASAITPSFDSFQDAGWAESIDYSHEPTHSFFGAEAARMQAQTFTDFSDRAWGAVSAICADPTQLGLACDTAMILQIPMAVGLGALSLANDVAVLAKSPSLALEPLRDPINTGKHIGQGIQNFFHETNPFRQGQALLANFADPAFAGVHLAGELAGLARVAGHASQSLLTHTSRALSDWAPQVGSRGFGNLGPSGLTSVGMNLLMPPFQNTFYAIPPHIEGLDYFENNPAWAFSTGSLAGTVAQIVSATGRDRNLVLYSESSAKDLEVPELQDAHSRVALLKVDGKSTTEGINRIIDQTPHITSFHNIFGVGGGGVKDTAMALQLELASRLDLKFEHETSFVSIPTQLSTIAAGTHFIVKDGNTVLITQPPALTVVPLDVLLNMDPVRSTNSLRSGLGDYLAGISFAASQAHYEGLPLHQALDELAAQPITLLQGVESSLRNGGSWHSAASIQSLAQALTDCVNYAAPRVSDEHNFFYAAEPLREAHQTAWPSHGEFVSFGTLMQTEAYGHMTGDFSLSDSLRASFGHVGLPNSVDSLARLGARPDQVERALMILPEAFKPKTPGLLRDLLGQFPLNERATAVNDLLNFRRP